MRFQETMRAASAVLLLCGGLALTARAESRGVCAQMVAKDAKVVSADLGAIAAQAKAQGLQAAVEQFAADLEEIVPTLNRPSQEAVEKFITDLSKAASESSPEGLGIRPRRSIPAVATM